MKSWPINILAAEFVPFMLAGCAALWTASAHAARDAAPLAPEITAFIETLADSHDFDRRQLRRWFSQARVQAPVLKAMANPATAIPWYQFRASHVTAARIRGGLEFWKRNADALARASAQYGLPEEIIVATLGVESFYGARMGRNRAFDALYTLAFAYPPRVGFFRGELEQFLLLARELHSSPLALRGSYAGALGIAQFLPGSYQRYAVDFNHDGKRDLWNDDDAIGSVANYYRAYGWQPVGRVLAELELPVEPLSGELRSLLGRGLNPQTTVSALARAGATPAEYVPEDTLACLFAAETESGTRYWLGFNNFYVITRYNRSVNYALAVFELARELRRAH